MCWRAPAFAQSTTSNIVSLCAFEEELLVRTIDGQDQLVRYIYLDRTWSAPDPRAVFFEWKKHKALALFGIKKFMPSRYVLRIASPPGCEIAQAIDWQVV